METVLLLFMNFKIAGEEAQYRESSEKKRVKFLFQPRMTPTVRSDKHRDQVQFFVPI